MMERLGARYSPATTRMQQGVQPQTSYRMGSGAVGRIGGGMMAGPTSSPGGMVSGGMPGPIASPTPQILPGSLPSGAVGGGTVSGLTPRGGGRIR